MMRRQHIYQWSEPKTPGALRHRGQKYAGRRRLAQRRRMVLAHVVDAKSGGIVELDQLQTVFVLFAERIRSAVVLIEYAELHLTTC
jgi:hypothetical protein